MQPDSDGDLGGAVLGIWAHPDDEAWLASGLMVRGVEAGHRVVCVTATRGEKGFPDDDPRPEPERAAVREREMAACLAILGVTEHQYLGYPDGGCADVPDEEAVELLIDILTEVRPAAVVTFAPDGGTGHPDHMAVCRWATAAVDRAGIDGTRLLYATRTRAWRERFFAGIDVSTVYMIPDLEPDDVDESELAVWFRCDDDLTRRKVRALQAQESQIAPFVEMAGGPDAFGELVRDEFYIAPRPGDRAAIERFSSFRL